MSKANAYVSVVALCVVGSAIFAANPNFVPDFVFKGSALAGWHKLGAADWRAENGEIIGAAKDDGGWLVMEKGYQDIGVYVSFRCSPTCKAGVLLRAEKTAEGMKGIFISLADGDMGAYDIVLDPQGKEVSRAKLGAGPGPMIRIASGRFSGGEDLVPGFSKPAPTRAELAAAAAAAAARPPAAGGGGRQRSGSGG